MKTKAQRSLLAFLMPALLISACGTGQLFGPTATLTPTVTSTLTYTPTFTSTFTPSATSTFTPTMLPQGPCDNPLVPLSANDRWSYRLQTDQGETLFSLASLGVENAANITAQIEFTNQKQNFTMHDSIICQQGAIVNYPLLVLNMLLADYLDGYIDSYHQSVDYAPTYASLAASGWVMDWKSIYLTENRVLLRDPLGRNDLLIAMPTQIDLSFSLDGVKAAITTPAGSFPQALRLTQAYLFPVTIIDPGGSSGSAGTLEILSTQWYEPYVGLLQAELTSVTLNRVVAVPLKAILMLEDFSR